MISANLPECHFATMVYGVLNTATRTFCYSAAGHPQPYLLRAGAMPQILDSGGMVLGLMPVTYEEATITLESGDRLLFYSDGIDGVSWPSQRKGVIGLLDWLGDQSANHPRRVVEDCLSFAESRSRLEDDITLLLVDLIQPAKEREEGTR
jgi:serine phosphatase RsbU (regulator of sigma subunit)